MADVLWPGTCTNAMDHEISAAMPQKATLVCPTKAQQGRYMYNCMIRQIYKHAYDNTIIITSETNYISNYYHMQTMNDNLVGGFNSSEKYWSVGMIIPNIWEELGRYFKKQTSHQPVMISIYTWALRQGKTGYHGIAMRRLGRTEVPHKTSIRTGWQS